MSDAITRLRALHRAKMQAIKAARENSERLARELEACADANFKPLYEAWQELSNAHILVRIDEDDWPVRLATVADCSLAARFIRIRLGTNQAVTYHTTENGMLHRVYMQRNFGQIFATPADAISALIEEIAAITVEVPDA